MMAKTLTLRINDRQSALINELTTRFAGPKTASKLLLGMLSDYKDTHETIRSMTIQKDHAESRVVFLEQLLTRAENACKAVIDRTSQVNILDDD